MINRGIRVLILFHLYCCSDKLSTIKNKTETKQNKTEQNRYLEMKP